MDGAGLDVATIKRIMNLKPIRRAKTAGGIKGWCAGFRFQRYDLRILLNMKVRNLIGTAVNRLFAL